MQFWRTIAALSVLLVLVSVQCRAKCVAIPHDTVKHSPECPLHKHKAPEKPSCTHAPQWDFEDAKHIAVLTAAPIVATETIVAPLPAPFLFPLPVPLPAPPLILRI
ncbi:MAG: hypothetical protein ACK6DZ_11585 [Acidobacteriota bacterium]